MNWGMMCSFGTPLLLLLSLAELAATKRGLRHTVECKVWSSRQQGPCRALELLFQGLGEVLKVWPHVEDTLEVHVEQLAPI